MKYVEFFVHDHFKKVHFNVKKISQPYNKILRIKIEKNKTVRVSSQDTRVQTMTEIDYLKNRDICNRVRSIKLAQLRMFSKSKL